MPEKRKPIDRIASGDSSRLSSYIAARQPVIVTGAFEGSSISELKSLEDVERCVGDEQVMVRQNYVASISSKIRALSSGRWGQVPPSRKTTISDFIRLVNDDPNGLWQATEVPTPQRIICRLDLAQFGFGKVIAGYDDGGNLSKNDACSLMFVAGEGNASDLHTDWDGKDVLLYQAFGRKRATLFRPDTAPLLHPVEIYGTVKLHDMAESQREGFINYANGWDDVLYPGETLFMPAFFWHHLEYMDTGVSFSFRFGGISNPDHVRILKEGAPDMYLQNVLAATLNQKHEVQASDALRLVLAALNVQYSSVREKYLALSNANRLAYAQIEKDIGKMMATTWLDSSSLIAGPLCNRFNAPPPGLNGLKRMQWLAKGKLHLFLRMAGARLASSF